MSIDNTGAAAAPEVDPEVLSILRTMQGDMQAVSSSSVCEAAMNSDVNPDGNFDPAHCVYDGGAPWASADLQNNFDIGQLS